MRKKPASTRTTQTSTKLATRKPSATRLAWHPLIRAALHQSIAAREPFPALHQRLWELREAAWLGTSPEIQSTEPGRILARIRHHIPAVSRYSYNAMFAVALRDISAELGIRGHHVEHIIHGVRVHNPEKTLKPSTTPRT